MNRSTLRHLALASLLALAACKSTPEEAPTDSGPIVRDAQPDTSADVADAASDVVSDVTTDASTDAAVDAPSDASSDASADASADAASDAPADVSCVGDGGCYACPPTTSSQIITRCTAASCARFDNAARLPRLLADGGLPPLP